MILIHLIKFIHILMALSLVGSTSLCFISTISKYNLPQITYKQLFTLALIALITGTLLVYPKHFTFHTHWIQAAYILITLYCVCVIILKQQNIKFKKIAFFTHFFMISLLILIIHDAVTKTTLLL